ncbi:hypothetical protein ABZ883_19725 [Streptomyces sp. NPDC046977]|uniref:hypothetical protein n=1 Tax=Streptomyces sp. NPDC046977 TaxID=3154703 RepID=UPI0033F6347C
MARTPRWYGANPLHLLVLLCSFALSAYACLRLFAVRPVEVAVWFVGAAVLHDLILLPLYSLADLSALAVLRRERVVPKAPWINHLRVPAFLSGLLLLVWFPLILGISRPYPAATALAIDVYLPRWLIVTAVLFGVSALAYALRLRRIRKAERAEKRVAGSGR